MKDVAVLKAKIIQCSEYVDDLTRNVLAQDVLHACVRVSSYCDNVVFCVADNRLGLSDIPIIPTIKCRLSDKEKNQVKEDLSHFFMDNALYEPNIFFVDEYYYDWYYSLRECNLIANFTLTKFYVYRGRIFKKYSEAIHVGLPYLKEDIYFYFPESKMKSIYEYCKQWDDFEDIISDNIRNHIEGRSIPDKVSFDINEYNNTYGTNWVESTIEEASKLYHKEVIESILYFSTYRGHYSLRHDYSEDEFYFEGVYGVSYLPYVLYIKPLNDDFNPAYYIGSDIERDIKSRFEDQPNFVASFFINKFIRNSDTSYTMFIKHGKIYIDKEEFEKEIYCRNINKDTSKSMFDEAMDMMSCK